MFQIKYKWEIINSNIKKKNKSNMVILKENDSPIRSEAIPNKFIEYFSNIADQLVSDAF